MDKLEVECNDNFERWIYILKNMDRLKEIPYKEVSDMWADFEVVADVGSMDRDERRVYESSLNSYRVLLSAFNKTAEEGHAEGMAQGMAQGMAKGLAEGMEKGLAEGMEKGLAEGMEKGLAEGHAEGLAEGIEQGKKEELKRVAQNMKLMGLDEKAIAEITGLSPEELKAMNL